MLPIRTADLLRFFPAAAPHTRVFRVRGVVRGGGDLYITVGRETKVEIGLLLQPACAAWNTQEFINDSDLDD